MRSGEYDDEWFETNIKPRLEETSPTDLIHEINGKALRASNGMHETVRLSAYDIERAKQHIAEMINVTQKAEKEFTAEEEVRKSVSYKNWKEFFTTLFKNSPQRNMSHNIEGHIDDLAFAMSEQYTDVNAPALSRNSEDTNPPNPYGE